MTSPESGPDRDYNAYVESVRSKNRVKMQQAIQKVREIYDSGTPFFTKDSIRRILQQIEMIEEGGRPGKVSLTGIDGNVVKVPVDSGRVHTDADDSDIEEVYSKARLSYFAVDHLTTYKNPLWFQRKFAYLMLSIGYTMNRRNARTKSPILQCPHLSFETVCREFQQKRAAWEASKQCEKVKALLDSTKPPPIQKIVAFACSSMTWNDEARYRSMVQHALVLTVQAALTADRSNSGIIKCYAQDPVYTEADKLVLQRENITILDDPVGFLEIDEETAVISLAPDIPVRQVTADITRPAMMIWDTVRSMSTSSPPTESLEDEDYSLEADPTSPRLAKMIEDYIELDFPEDPANFCKDTAVYIRKS